MLARAGAIWFGIMLTAILNGALRDALLVPRLGELVARVTSCLILAATILIVTFKALPWIQMADAWRIGFTWLAMAPAFEFGAGITYFARRGPRCSPITTRSPGDCGFGY